VTTAEPAPLEIGRNLTMQTVTLNNGVEMPVLGFGVFQVPEEETEQAVSSALEAGYRSLHTAQAYQNEAQQQMAELGVQIESWGPFAEGRNGLFTNATLLKIAEEQGRTVAQVVLRWLTQRGVVAIPKSVRPERMAENLASQDFDLTDTDMAEIAALDTGETQFFDHHDPQWVRSLGTRRIS
jgi:2,5-diketo-D-gluconate reductase A